LGTKYSQAIGAFFQDKDGKKKPIVMGCYGIGISRTMGAIVEVYHDEKGIIWPKEVSPFDFHLLSLFSGKRKVDREIKKTCQKVLKFLQKEGLEVLYDDREKKTAGEKFADADLIGIHWRIVVSERTLRKNSVEIKKRSGKKIQLLKIRDLPQFLNSKFKSQNAK